MAKVIDLFPNRIHTPRAQLEHLVLSCTQAGLDAYRDAANALRDGDDYGAGLLHDCASRALDAAREAAEGLASLCCVC